MGRRRYSLLTHINESASLSHAFAEQAQLCSLQANPAGGNGSIFSTRKALEEKNGKIAIGGSFDGHGGALFQYC